jgi:hypothetical protein
MSVLEDISKLCIARSLLAGSFSLVLQEEKPTRILADV